MANVPSDLRYTKEHEWVSAGDGRARVGITHHAQEQLGDIVYVELPEMGRAVERGEAMAAVESVKAVSDVYAPVSGKVVAVNEALEGAPETVNRDPYGEGWMVEIELADPGQIDELLDATAYEALLAEEANG